MDFISAAQIIIPELSRLAVTVCEAGDWETLGEFEKHFCFMPGRQPLYTASGLQELFSKKSSDKIYLSIDALGTHCVFIEVESRWIILGPFAVSAWRDGEARKRLSAAGASTLRTLVRHACISFLFVLLMFLLC